MRYTLRQLEIFLAIAQQENLSRAADQMALSQSAASGALKELEQQFDIKLFDRVGKRLRLNDLGRSLQPKAEALIEQARELENALADHGEVGTIRVGATMTIGNYLAVPLVQKYLQSYPDRSVHLEVGNTAEMVEQLSHFELDMALIEGEINHPDLSVTRWREDELVLFCAPEHALVQASSVGTGALLAAHWVLREQGSGTRQVFDRAFHELLPDLSIRLELQHTEAILQAVVANLGVGCLSRMAVADALASGRICELNVPERDLTRWLYLVLHKDKYRTAALQQWLTNCGFVGTK